VLPLIADGPIHGYSVIRRLDQLGVSSDGIDVGMAYRTMREFDAKGLVRTRWDRWRAPWDPDSDAYVSADRDRCGRDVRLREKLEHVESDIEGLTPQFHQAGGG
jgi:hypothetical protein